MLIPCYGKLCRFHSRGLVSSSLHFSLSYQWTRFLNTQQWFLSTNRISMTMCGQFMSWKSLYVKISIKSKPMPSDSTQGTINSNRKWPNDYIYLDYKEVISSGVQNYIINSVIQFTQEIFARPHRTIIFVNMILPLRKLCFVCTCRHSSAMNVALSSP